MGVAELLDAALVHDRDPVRHRERLTPIVRHPALDVRIERERASDAANGARAPDQGSIRDDCLLPSGGQGSVNPSSCWTMFVQ
jgi:hypothetical protein